MPAPVIAVLNSKGGCGKTTVAVHLARGLQVIGSRVLLVDTDPQESSATWRSLQSAVAMPEVEVMHSDRIDAKLDAARTSFDVIVVDGAPRATKRTAATIRTADVVLIPVRPSAFDLVAAAEVVELVKTRRRTTRGRPRAAFVVNDLTANSLLAAEVDVALAEYGLPVLAARLNHRVAYMSSINEGLTVYEVGRGRARDEVRELVAEVQSLL